ncbi:MULTISPECIES: Sir2 family NAD-dependent protein deacetylase [unclassified Lentimicrobium]|uniref:SIR2 family NAD-dependent protein deacylase n=1 Tax=unclassified Lentimicrobium TaxID=2677434 RepID=UPI001554B993|nr:MULTISPECIES: Sir2 family NAD-dependent protein deacetylase [unclassified Lentimicrobium]NPD45943.1 RNA polymerase subunit sigma [Lentimicrobium sp. S6]NPD84290.1 RNA polymerase subunit sigma [Lentimicrobium sp. L6]
MESIIQAAHLIINSKRTFAFTGAGISVESGIPTFRGEDGIWNHFNPKLFDLQYYLNHPNKAWPHIKRLFYKEPNSFLPNKAHWILADWEKRGFLEGTITQNIDYLHQSAGSKLVYEIHGTTNSFICLSCNTIYNRSEIIINKHPPTCLNKACSSLLKPNFTFFGEGIPQHAFLKSQESTLNTDVYLVIGTSGEVCPANQIPIMAKQNGTTIIEINTKPSLYTKKITDLFIQGRSTKIIKLIDDKIKSFLTK